MSATIKNVLGQPLLHFLLLGGLLFVLYYAINPGSNSKETIVIDDDQVSRIVTVFQKEWNRMPTDEEMKGLLEKYVEEEIYYRKALEMNLDHNDEIIRRRLDQKLQFITNDMATLNEPKEADLQAYYTTNSKKYLLPVSYSFSHIYFNPDNRSDAEKDAANVLSALPSSDQPLDEIIKKGDPFPFAYHVDSLTEKEIAGQMGDEFVTALHKLPLKKWTGPVQSGYGMHLIYVDAVKTPAAPELSQVRADVLRDYQYDLQQKYNAQMLEDFRKDFTVQFNIKDPKQSTQFSQLLSSK